MSKKKSIISTRIKDDYGTVKFFCKKHDLNYNTVSAVIYGVQRSKKITKLFKELNYLRDESDIPQGKNAWDKIYKAKQEVA